MRTAQVRQRPRRSAYETSGRLSCHAIGVAHDMHAEGGRTTDLRSGTRAATTFRKLPTARPGRKTAAARAASIPTPRSTAAGVAGGDVVPRADAAGDDLEQRVVRIPRREVAGGPRDDGAELAAEGEGAGEVEHALADVPVERAVVDLRAPVHVHRAADRQRLRARVPGELAVGIRGRADTTGVGVGRRQVLERVVV